MAWWYAAAGAVALAVFAGIRDWRRARRDDLDSISLINWPSVQMFALIAAAVCAALATHQ